MQKDKNAFTNEETTKLRVLQNKIRYKFRDVTLLKLALSHSSWVYEQPFKSDEKIRFSNERLEFLGDAVVGFLSVEKIYRNYPFAAEGSLARVKAVIASESLLSRAAKKIRLGTFLFLGKGEERSGGRERDSILADAFEALCGAIFLDSGLPEVLLLLDSTLFPLLQDIYDDVICLDYKSKLQELTQGQEKILPEYRLVSVSGPPHCPVFTVEVLLDSKVLASGEGRSKKDAEQEAAEKGIRVLSSGS
jgi:ribonuclease-3